MRTQQHQHAGKATPSVIQPRKLARGRCAPLRNQRRWRRSAAWANAPSLLLDVGAQLQQLTGALQPNSQRAASALPLALVIAGIVASLVVLQAGALTARFVRKSLRQQRDPLFLTDADVQETDKLMALPSRRADVVRAEIQEEEAALQKATVGLEDTRRSWLTMVGLIGLFEFATVGFRRTPDNPLQP